VLLKGRCLGTGRDIIGIMRLWCALLSTLTVAAAADLGRFESARTVTLEFGGDIPDHGIFSEDVRRVTRGLALHEVPAAESDLLVRIKGNIRYNYRTFLDRANAEGAERRVVTTRIRGEGMIVARLIPKGPEVSVEFSCDSGMPLAPAWVASPYDIDPLPSVEEISACLARHVDQLLSPVLKREQRPSGVRDQLAVQRRRHRFPDPKDSPPRA